MCQKCAVEFTVLVRRHHCRACGQVRWSMTFFPWLYLPNCSLFNYSLPFFILSHKVIEPCLHNDAIFELSLISKRLISLWVVHITWFSPTRNWNWLNKRTWIDCPFINSRWFVQHVLPTRLPSDTVTWVPPESVIPVMTSSKVVSDMTISLYFSFKLLQLQ